MLSKKLKLNSGSAISVHKLSKDRKEEDDLTSKHFVVPFWKRFFNVETALNKEIEGIIFEPVITHVYNPIEYASDVHCAYLRKFLTGPKELMFLGMNPGPNGMVQNGVPFGNTQTVRDWMRLEGNIMQPNKLHPKRPVVGFKCQTEEPSGVRFWGLLRDISTDLDIFSQRCFMHSVCPLALFDNHGRNITPSELKGPSKKEVQIVCIKYLDKKLELIEPKIIVAVGNYAAECLKQLQKQKPFKYSTIKILQLPHPSPRSVNNNDWPEKARKFFEENDLIKYIKNECSNG